MNAQTLVQRYRVFLFALAAFLCVGTLTELWLTEHTQEPLQLVPFVLCVLGLLAILAAWFKPQIQTLWTMRVLMGAFVLGALIGVSQHLASNWEIIVETKPQLAASEMFFTALRGAAPMLAPGILALIAILALAATYAHPALEPKSQK